MKRAFDNYFLKPKVICLTRHFEVNAVCLGDGFYPISIWFVFVLCPEWSLPLSKQDTIISCRSHLEI